MLLFKSSIGARALQLTRSADRKDITLLARQILVVAMATLVGCATTSSTGSRIAPSTNADGISCERRVKVSATPDEYAWVKAHYPGAKVKMQALIDCNGSPTDMLQITTSEGRNVMTYFDISSFF